MDHSILATPVKIGRLTLRNRIVMPPMGTNLGDEHVFPGQNLADYVEARARAAARLW